VTNFDSLIRILHFFRIKQEISSKKSLLYQRLSTACWVANECLATTTALGEKVAPSRRAQQRATGKEDTSDNLANYHYILVRLSYCMKFYRIALLVNPFYKLQ